jgi:hypothetical protein
MLYRIVKYKRIRRWTKRILLQDTIQFRTSGQMNIPLQC